MNTKRLSIRISLLSALMLTLAACTSNNTNSLTGHWKLDSIYYFDNGFSYINKAPFPSEVHVYKKDSTFLRRGMGRENSFVYSLRNNELYIRDTSSGAVAKFTIIAANNKSLTLKKEKELVFAGKNQERFEVRFFSRLPNDSIN